MASKDRNKRSARKARAEERARVEAAQATSAPEASGKPAKAVAKTEKKPEKKSDKKPGIFRRLLNYLGEVRSEMRRVVWPSKEELKSYSSAIIVMLIILCFSFWGGFCLFYFDIGRISNSRVGLL